MKRKTKPDRDTNSHKTNRPDSEKEKATQREKTPRIAAEETIRMSKRQRFTLPEHSDNEDAHLVSGLFLPSRRRRLLLEPLIKQKSNDGKPGSANSEDGSAEAAAPPGLSTAADEVLTKCPGVYCEDAIPSVATPVLKDALKKYRILCNAKGSKQFDVARLANDICHLVRQEHKRVEAIRIAQERKWPAFDINFKDIPQRVLAMFGELDRIMLQRDARENLYVWGSFEADLEHDGWSEERFGRMDGRNISATSQVWKNSRGG